MPTDQELLTAIINGDEEALAALYRSYYRRLCGFLLRVTGDSELVVEIINDVFLVVWQNAGRFRGDASVSSWVIGIAYRKALKALKKSRPWLPLDEAPQAALTSADATSAAVELESSLAQLSPEHRAVMELTYYFGYSYREIGEILECPENTVKTRMYHARRLLQSIMEV
jgi:RNA polymerase sigma-70 factor (ECF subfamily)